MSVNYIICAAGRGSRFEKLFPDIPKPLIKLQGRYLIDWSLDSLPIQANDTLIFITQKIHGVKTKVYDYVKNKFKSVQVKWLEIDGLTGGQLETALAAKDLYDPKSSIAIFNCDTFFKSGTLLQLINDPNVEGIIPSSQEPGESWSFSKVDENDRVIDTAEKQRISDWASVGLYYFRDQARFLELAQGYLKVKAQGETYVAPFYKLYLQTGANIVIDRALAFKPMGTVEQIENYWHLSIQEVIEENYNKVER